jgi:hypothetical protein
MSNKGVPHPTIPGVLVFESTFTYSWVGRPHTGHYREIVRADEPGSISIQARSHQQHLRIEALELGPENIDQLIDMVRDSAAWLVEHKPEFIP